MQPELGARSKRHFGAATCPDYDSGPVLKNRVQIARALQLNLGVCEFNPTSRLECPDTLALQISFTEVCLPEQCFEKHWPVLYAACQSTAMNKVPSAIPCLKFGVVEVVQSTFKGNRQFFIFHEGDVYSLHVGT